MSAYGSNPIYEKRLGSHPVDAPTGFATPRDGSPIDQALEDLLNAQIDTGQALADLQARLSGVLRAVDPEKGDDGACYPSDMPRVLIDLCERRDWQLRLRNQIRSLADRLVI